MYRAKPVYSLTPRLCFLLLFALLMASTPQAQASDVSTSFETTDTSGNFTLGTAPKTVTFTNGEAKFAGNGELYRTGSQAWMVKNNTGSVTFETPAGIVTVYLKAETTSSEAIVNVFDVNENLVTVFEANTEWQEIALTSNDGIARIELVNPSDNYVVFDDFSFTAISSGGSGENPTKLEDPLPLPIFEGGLKLRLEMVTDGLTSPLWGVSAPGVDDFMYVIDQTGPIWAINTSDGSKTQVADLSGLMVSVGGGGFDERGLLGLAFHPAFAENHRLYTFTSQPVIPFSNFSTMPEGTTAAHQSVITEWQATIGGDGGITIDSGSARELLRIDQPQSNHNGGAIAFDADGLLYIALGDGGNADDKGVGHGETGNAQDTLNPLGKILRIDPLGSQGPGTQYGIPGENPFIEQDGLSEIYAYGLRNPYRMSFDRQTGDLYAADVGQNAIEEINLITGARNYGWNHREGSFGFFSDDSGPGYVYEQPDSGGTVDPLVQYDHDEGVAVIGGFVYRGSQFESMQGRYVFGDFNGRLFYINGEGTLAEFQDVDSITPGALLGFAQDSQGELYALTNATGQPSGTSGTIYRLTIVENQAPTANAGADQTVNEGSAVTLDASQSSDPDGDTLGYEWSQTAGPSVTLSDTTAASPTFTAPAVDADTVLTFSVLVNDGHLSATATVNVTVSDVPATTPPPTTTPPTSSSGGGGSLFWLWLLGPLAWRRTTRAGHSL